MLATNQTDGLRASFANGDIVHLRPSGNAPELRCYAEADTAERATAPRDACLARVAASI
jgi:phosphomannomutase